MPPEVRARYLALPNGVIVREQAVALAYVDMPWTPDEREQAGEGGHGRTPGRAPRRSGRR